MIKKVFYHAVRSFFGSSDQKEKHRALLKILLTTPKEKLQFLDFTIYFSNFSSVTFLLEEIFLEEHYKISLPEKNLIIFDCGSNIGLSCLFFKTHFPNAQITCFEPNPHSFYYLQRNVSANRLDKVTCVEKALGASREKVSFFIDEKHPTSLANSTLATRMTGSKIEIQQQQLSSFLKHRVNLVKIDIEGAEYDVLLDLEKTKTIHLVDHFIIEFHRNIGEKHSLEEFINILERNQFRVDLPPIDLSPTSASEACDLLLRATNLQIGP